MEPRPVIFPQKDSLPPPGVRQEVLVGHASGPGVRYTINNVSVVGEKLSYGKPPSTGSRSRRRDARDLYFETYCGCHDWKEHHVRRSC